LGQEAFRDLFALAVESSNDWADCARKHGFPGTIDAEMPIVFDYSQVPTTLLPSYITEDQLRALLEACPSLDVEAQRQADNLWDGGLNLNDPTSFEVPEGYYVAPNIGFDYPGFDGRHDGRGATQTPDPEVVERLTRLQDVLNEAWADYEADKYS
jgi:hypothetical protein